MKLRRTNAFDRAYRKLTEKHRLGVDSALRIFFLNPFDVRLRNHKLSGSREGVRSIRAGYDLRILYVESSEQEVFLLLTLGTHDQVY